MVETAATQVFVPRIFDTPDTRGIVVKAYKAEGEFIAADEPLIDLRSHDVDGEIVAPFAATIVRLHTLHGDTVSAGTLLADLRAHVPEPPRGVPGKARTRLAGFAPLMAALLVASPALVLPLVWLALVPVALLVLAVARDVLTRRAGGLGLAPLTLVPRLFVQFVRWLRRSIADLTPPLAGATRLLVGLALAVFIPAVIGGALWRVEHGEEGINAAARIAIADHAFRVFAFLTCFWLVRRFWRQADRAKALEKAVRPVPTPLFVPAYAAILACTAACTVMLPSSTWAPLANFRAAADLLPVDGTEWVLRTRAAWAQNEAVAMNRCLANAGRGKWRSPTVTVRADGSMLASFPAQPGVRPGDRSVATLLLAAQNQLEPHALTVVVHMGGNARLRFDTVATREPTTEVDALLGRAQATSAAAERFAGLHAIKPTDVDVALRCSAAGI